MSVRQHPPASAPQAGVEAAADGLPPTLEAVARQRIAQSVCARLQHSAPEPRLGYIRLAQALPRWLQQHGLANTVGYLRLLAVQRRLPGAAELWHDWLCHGAPKIPVAPSLADLLAAMPAPPQAMAARLAAERQAWREAWCFKRYAEMLADADGLPTANPPAPAQAPSSAPVSGVAWPAWWWQGAGGPASAPSSAPWPAIRHVGVALRTGTGVLGQPAHPDQGGDKTWRTQQVAALVALADTQARDPDALALYSQALDRRRCDLTHLRCRVFERRLRQHLYSAQGERGVWETYVGLHPSHGWPVLRASALKSVLRRYLVQAWLPRLDEAVQASAAAWINTLLGDATGQHLSAAVLQVHDAWWVPEPGGGQAGPLVADVDTPHHSAYYQGRQAQARPTDSPEPQPQWAVRGRFLFAVGLPPALWRSPAPQRPTWARAESSGAPAGDGAAASAADWAWVLDLAADALAQGLCHGGVGGAARVGGGRFADEAPVLR